MKITRETMRADGQTVGQAMDADAAFLRSIGVDAKDGRKPYLELQSDFIQKVRDTVLNALDEASPTGKGWEDKDLTPIFKAIDQHAETLFIRLYNQGVDFQQPNQNP